MSEFRTSDGVRLYYEQRGHGPRVFACTGGPANDHRYLADDLAVLEDNFEFVFHDYRGSGRSSPAAPASYTFARLAADLDELRAYFGDDRIVVLGHSMGGFVALTYATQHAAYCERLVLIGTFPSAVPSKMLPGTVRALGWARAAKLMGRAAAWVLTWSWRPRTEERKRRLYGVWATLQEGRADVRAREIERERQLGVPLDNDNVRSLQRQFPSLDLTDSLSLIACPSLIMYGTRDASAVWGANVYRTHLPSATIASLDDIGHDPLFEAPNEAASTIRSFLLGETR